MAITFIRTTQQMYYYNIIIIAPNKEQSKCPSTMLYFDIMGYLLNGTLISNRKIIHGTIWAHFQIIYIFYIQHKIIYM